MKSAMVHALVVQNHDPEGYGRVRVEYPWIQGSTAGQPSQWARVCQPYASNGSGGWFIPEVGDEVVVCIQEGDLDHPLVMGCVHNGRHTPADPCANKSPSSDSDNALKYLVTRSGHVLCFDDSDAERSILLADAQGRRIEIHSASDRVEVSDSKGNRLSIEAGKVSLSTTQGDRVELSGGEVTIRSQKVKIEAAGSLELGTGAGEALIKGTSFMSLFNAHTHVSGGPGSPTSPPSTPMTPGELSTVVKTA